MANRSKRCITICSKLAEFRNEGLFCDVEVVIQDKRFLVHKAVLMATSSYFSAMFTGSFAEQHEKTVHIQDLSSSVFNIILDYLYGGEIELSLENVQDVYTTADMLCLDELVGDCKTFFENNWDKSPNVVDIYETAELFNMVWITYAITYRAKNDLISFLKSNDISKLPFNFWTAVLGCGNERIHIESAPLLLEHILKWTFFRPDERLPDVLDLLSLVPFELISPTRIRETAKFVASNEDCIVPEQLSYFKECLDALYRNSCKTAVNQQVNIIFVIYKESLIINVLNTADWNWEHMSCDLQTKPESCLLRDEDLYIFTGEGCMIFNLRNQQTSSLPAFPEKRRRSAFSVLDNTLYVLGGVHEYTGRPLCDMLELKASSDNWFRRISWTGPICDARSVSFSHNIFFVGWKDAQNKSSCNRSCYVYNSITKCFKQIGRLFTCDCKLKFAFYEDVLYVFSESFRIVEAVDIEKEQLLPWTEINILEYTYQVLDVCAIDDGILIAYFLNGTVLLGLYKPSKSSGSSVKLLSFAPQVNPWDHSEVHSDWTSTDKPYVFIQKRKQDDVQTPCLSE